MFKWLAAFPYKFSYAPDATAQVFPGRRDGKESLSLRFFGFCHGT
jgi:hypothetical protein